MAAANQAEFNDQTAVYLTAGGWDAQGRRSGGIVLPRGPSVTYHDIAPLAPATSSSPGLRSAMQDAAMPSKT